MQPPKPERANENAASRRRSRPDSKSQSNKSAFVSERAPFGDVLSPTGTIRRDLEKAGLLGDDAAGPIFRAPWLRKPSAERDDVPPPPTWDELPGIATDATLKQTRIRKAAEVAVAAGCRPPRTVAERRHAVALAGMWVRHFATRGRDPKPALRQYVLRKRELATTEFVEAFWSAVGKLLSGSKALLREQIRRDREAGLSIRQIARSRGLSKSEVGRLSQEN